MRQLGHAEFDFHMAAVRNPLRILHSLPGIREEPFHFLFALYIVLSAHIPHPVLIRQLFRRLDAKQHVMGFLIFRIGIVDIVSNHQGDIQFFAHLKQRRIHRFLLRDSMILQFQEIIPLPKTGLIFPGRLLSFIYQPFGNIPLYLPRQARGKGDDPFVEFIQYFHVHTGFIVVALRKASADNFHQIGIPCIIFRQKHQMVIPVFPAGQFLIKPGIGRHIHFTADNGVNPLRLRRFIKINDPVHYPVVRNRCAVHAQFPDPLDIFFYFIGTIQKTVFRMHM